MKPIRDFLLAFVGAIVCFAPMYAQAQTNTDSLDVIAERLEQLERQNSE